MKRGVFSRSEESRTGALALDLRGRLVSNSWPGPPGPGCPSAGGRTEEERSTGLPAKVQVPSGPRRAHGPQNPRRG